MPSLPDPCLQSMGTALPSASPTGRTPWVRRWHVRNHPLEARPQLPHSRASRALGITWGVEVCSELIGGTTDKLDPSDSSFCHNSSTRLHS